MVLVVGNVLPRKNLAVVARAVRLMRDRGSDVVLRVVGAVHPRRPRRRGGSPPSSWASA